MVKSKLRGKAHERYEELEKCRTNWLNQAYTMAELTIPYILPRTEHTTPDNLPIPYSNIGAFAVKTLASKLMLQVLPPNQAFFRMGISPKARRLLSKSDPDGKVLSEIEEKLADLEQRTLREVGRGTIRAVATEVLLHYVIVGNVVMHVPTKGNPSMTDLRSFVVKRSYDGDLLELIVEDCANKASLSKEQLSVYVPKTAEKDSDDEEVEIYTVMELIDDKYHVWQEISGNVVPKSTGTYDRDKAPFIVLRATATAGEDYGHSYVSAFQGDLMLSEGLTKAVKQGSLASSRIVFGVDPAAPPGLEQQLTEAPNCSFHRFKPEHVQAVQVQKQSDLTVAANMLSDVHARIRTGFLMAYQRNAERVTAEENRIHYQELQAVLGGTFSMLAADFQVPLVNRIIARLKANGDLDDMADAVNVTIPTIVTGIDAIGRASDLNNLMAFTEIVQKAFGAELAGFLNTEEYIKRVAAATNVRTKSLIKSEEQINAMRQAQNMQQLGEKAVGPAIGAMAQMQQGQAK